MPDHGLGDGPFTPPLCTWDGGGGGAGGRWRRPGTLPGAEVIVTNKTVVVFAQRHLTISLNLCSWSYLKHLSLVATSNLGNCWFSENPLGSAAKMVWLRAHSAPETKRGWCPWLEWQEEGGVCAPAGGTRRDRPWNEKRQVGRITHQAKWTWWTCDLSIAEAVNACPHKTSTSTQGMLWAFISTSVRGLARLLFIL